MFPLLYYLFCGLSRVLFEEADWTIGCSFDGTSDTSILLGGDDHGARIFYGEAERRKSPAARCLSRTALVCLLAMTRLLRQGRKMSLWPLHLSTVKSGGANVVGCIRKA